MLIGPRFLVSRADFFSLRFISIGVHAPVWTRPKSQDNLHCLQTGAYPNPDFRLAVDQVPDS